MANRKDRRVHAEDVVRQVVRYDRAGKWYVEWRGGQRDHVDIREAALQASTLGKGGIVHYGLSGGSAFDRLVREMTGG